MKTIRRNPLLFGVIGSALFLSVLLALRPYVFPAPTLIGDFVMPTLSGWSKDVQTTSRSQSVKYLKRDGKNRLAINFVWQLNRAGNPPRTVQDLQKEQAKDALNLASSLQNTGVKIQSTPPQPIVLGAMPAVESRSVATLKSQATYGRSVDFVKGRNYYKLTTNISLRPAASPSPEIQTEMDKAYETITNSITSP